MPQFTAATPILTPAYALRLERAAPATIGAIATGGTRRVIAIRGGELAGEGQQARVISGTETELTRADGLTTLEVSYVLECDGTVLRAFGTGFRKGSDARDGTGETDFAGLRLSLLFEAAQDGPLAHLATRAFVGEQADGATMLSICRID